MSSDIYSLNRFISAQDKVYDYVLSELKYGKKLSFKYISEDNSIFEKVLNKYFSNEECNKTKQILDKES